MSCHCCFVDGSRLAHPAPGSLPQANRRRRDNVLPPSCPRKVNLIARHRPDLMGSRSPAGIPKLSTSWPLRYRGHRDSKAWRWRLRLTSSANDNGSSIGSANHEPLHARRKDSSCIQSTISCLLGSGTLPFREASGVYRAIKASEPSERKGYRSS